MLMLIVVMQIKGKQVRLGIKAKATTIVHREEVYQRIQNENELAMQVEKSAVNAVGNVISAAPSLGTRSSALRRRS